MSTNSTEGQGHPAYQAILNILPDEFHKTVIDELTKMDQGVQKKLQDVRDEYKGLEGFKPFVDSNIDADYAQQAVQLAHQLQNDPGATLQQINDAWNLGYTPAGQAPPEPQSLEEEYGDVGDISKHPEFVAMKQALESVQTGLSERQQRELADQEADQFEDYLDGLEEKYKDQGGFDRTFVTAYMTQGIEGDDAVKAYQDLVKGNATQHLQNGDTQKSEQPPSFVSMGGDGNTGSGMPEQPVNFGGMKSGDVSDAVAEMLKQVQENDNQQG